MDWDRLVQSAMAELRASLNWMPFAKKTAKFSIGWGIYDIPLNLSVIGQTADQQQVDTLYDATGKVLAGPATSQFVLQPGGVAAALFRYYERGVAAAVWGEDHRFGGAAGARPAPRVGVRDANAGQIGSEFLLQSTRRDKYRGATISGRHSFGGGAECLGATRDRGEHGPGA